MKLYQKILLYISLVIIAFAIVFYLGVRVGKKEVLDNIVTNTVYVPSEPIHDSIPVLIPVKEIIPPDTLNIIKECVKKGIYSELFPEKIVDNIVYVPDIDSTAIVQDWATTRYYSETLFDSDTLGSCTVDATVQYNRLSNLKYKYSPVVKYNQVLYTEKERALSPFVGAGISTPVGLTGQVGVFVKDDWGVSLTYNRDFIHKTDNFGLMCLYKF